MSDIRDSLLSHDAENKEDVGFCSRHVALKKRHYFYAMSIAGLCTLGFVHSGPDRSLPTQLESMDTSGWGDATCYKYTGHSCSLFRGCPEDLNANCSKGGSCWCKSGCVGSDGRCYPHTKYRVVGKKIKFRNVYFKNQYLYTPRYWLFQQLATADKKEHHWYAYNWNVYQLPGDMWVPRGTYGANSHTFGYFLSPDEFPGYVAGIAETKFRAEVPFTGGALNPKTHTIANGMNLPIGSEFVVDLYKLSENRWLSKPFNPELVVNSLCRPIGRPQAVRIIGAFGKIAWYEHLLSWSVFGWVFSTWGSATRRDEWIPEPQLNISLPTCPQEHKL